MEVISWSNGLSALTVPLAPVRSAFEKRDNGWKPIHASAACGPMRPSPRATGEPHSNTAAIQRECERRLGRWRTTLLPLRPTPLSGPHQARSR
jgi:hypothetical protein